MHKPRRSHRTRGSCYLIAKNLQLNQLGALVAINEWREPWNNATFSPSADEGKQDRTDFVEQVEEVSRLLASFGERLIELGGPVWEIQKNTLCEAPLFKIKEAKSPASKWACQLLVFQQILLMHLHNWETCKPANDSRYWRCSFRASVITRILSTIPNVTKTLILGEENPSHNIADTLCTITFHAEASSEASIDTTIISFGFIVRKYPAPHLEHAVSRESIRFLVT